LRRADAYTSAPVPTRLPLLSVPVRRRPPISVLAALLPALLLANWPASSAASSSLSFIPCANSPGFSCTTVPVPLDRSGRVPGTISLSVERKTAGATQSRDAVVALAGGPGQATLPLGAFIAEAIAPALGARDLLIFDQRGTGASDPLSCPALSSAKEIEKSNAAGELIARCALQIGPARGAFTTQESVEDIEAIRQAGGYEKLVLYGTSYGTKVALEYAERYPEHVEALVLDSAETPEGPEPFHVDTFKAMTPVLQELCSRRACAGVTRNPVADLAHLTARLRAHALAGEAYGEHGKRFKLSVTSRDLFGLLLDGDLNPVIRAEMPAAIHSALSNDPAPLSRLVVLAGIHPAGENSEVDSTLFVDTSCEETQFPWQRAAPEATRAVEAEAALNALPGSDFYPFDPESGLLDQTIPLCVSWPDASPAPPAQSALPDVPTLILSGGQDLRTPTENAQRVAKLIPDAQLVTVPYTGHSVIGSDFSGCAKSAVATFFDGAPVKACGLTVNHFPPAPLAPTRLSAMTPTPGVGGAAGRTLAATLDSVLDLRRAIVEIELDFGEPPLGVRFGGLRGGSVKITKAGAELDRLSYIPGVQISGLIPTGILLQNKGSAANLSISGSTAANGHLRISAGGHFSGVLARQPFSVSVSAKVKLSRAGGAGDGAEWSAGKVTFPLPGLARVR
jgi:pimeloyl-ACP methyl ester carboxylesterase